MDDETKKLIVDNYALNKENNVMLKKLINFQKWNQVYKVVYWAVIILFSFGALYFIKPFLNTLVGVYTGGVGVSDMGSVTKNLGNSTKDMTELLKSLNGN